MTLFILASQSRARAALLKAAGYRFRQIPSEVEEPAPAEGTHLEHHVMELARLKAEAVSRRYPKAIVIGADTALILEGRIIGKPDNLAGAARMLGDLCGRTHRISSAACIILPAGTQKGRRRVIRVTDTAHVQLRRWSVPRIRAFVNQTRPLSWAGAYAVQDPLSAAIVERIEGDLATVIGLPLGKLDRILKKLHPSAA
jgi:septum formation protein